MILILYKQFAAYKQSHIVIRNEYPSNLEEANYELQEAARKIFELEQKIMILEKKVPKTYPDVKFLNYLTRKRILVTKIDACLSNI